MSRYLVGVHQRVGRRATTQFSTLTELTGEFLAATDREDEALLAREIALIGQDLVNEAPVLAAISSNPAAVHFFNSVSLEETDSFEMTPSAFGESGAQLFLASDGRVVAYDEITGDLQVIAVEAGTVVLSLSIGADAKLAVSATSNELAIAAANSGSIIRYDTTTGTQLASVIPVGYSTRSLDGSDVLTMIYNSPGTELALLLDENVVSFIDLVGSSGEDEVTLPHTSYAPILAYRGDGTSVYTVGDDLHIVEASRSGVLQVSTTIADSPRSIHYVPVLDQIMIVQDSNVNSKKLTYRAAGDVDDIKRTICLVTLFINPELENVPMIYGRDFVMFDRFDSTIRVIDSEPATSIENFFHGIWTFQALATLR